jgi:acyl-coenzyme A thioesterase PaaI-like protein
VTTGITDLEFDRGIALVPRDEPTVYDVQLDGGWRIGAGINGGLLLAVLGNALRHTFPVPHRDPFSISAYYLSASRPGRATVRTQVLRAGRATTTGQASLSQPGADGEVERIRAVAAFGDLAGLPEDVRTTAEPPDLPPPEQCVSPADAPPASLEQAELLRRLDLRLDPACVGWAVGQPSGTGEIRGWLRMVDGREPDPLLLLLAVDSLPPVSFDLGLFGWTPTLELTAHVRALPAPGWLLVSHATRNLAGGLLEEDAEVWDSAGRLVAQSRQLALVPRPRP